MKTFKGQVTRKNFLGILIVGLFFGTGVFAASFMLMQYGILSYRYISSEFSTLTRITPLDAKDAQEIADSTPSHPEVILTDPGDERNCGALGDESRGGGCWSSESPNSVYVSRNLLKSEKALRYVVLHESAHAYQYQTGQKRDECEADRIAVEWGADQSQTNYVRDGVCTDGGLD
jgi:hypothetical protein